METKQFKAALFDLDGVVFDTEPQYTKFWGAQCREFRPDYPGLEHAIKGQTLCEILENYFGGELASKQSLIWSIVVVPVLKLSTGILSKSKNSLFKVSLLGVNSPGPSLQILKAARI